MRRHIIVVDSWSLVFLVVIVTLGLYGYVAVEATREAMFLHYDDMSGADMSSRDYDQEYALIKGTGGDDGGYGGRSGFERGRGNDGKTGYGDDSDGGITGGLGDDGGFNSSGGFGSGDGRGSDNGFGSGRNIPGRSNGGNGSGGGGSEHFGSGSGGGEED